MGFREENETASTATATKEKKEYTCRKCGNSMHSRFYSVGGETYVLYGGCSCTLPLQEKIGMIYPMDETKLTTHQKETADPSFPLSCTSCHSRVLQYEKWIDFNQGFWSQMVSKCEHTLDPNYVFSLPSGGPVLDTAPTTNSEPMEHISEYTGELPLDNQQEDITI